MSRVTVEDLLENAHYRYDDPKLLLVRVYEKGVDPIEPNPFKFAVIAIINSGVCTFKAMANSGVKIADLRDTAAVLKDFGATEFCWRHDGVDHAFTAYPRFRAFLQTQ